MIREVHDLSQLQTRGTDLEFLRCLGGPTLIYQGGQDDSRTRVVSTLLHGNEPSGLRAVQAWLRSERTPETQTLFYIASVEAALAPPAFSQRTLPQQRDANRCFLPPFFGSEGELSQYLLTLLFQQNVEALVDLHNNTGQNPAYGVVIQLDPAREALVRHFGSKCIVSDLMLGTLIEATDRSFPSVVVECGRAGALEADRTALQGLSSLLSASTLGQLHERVPKHEAFEVLEHPLRVTLTPETELGFGNCPGRGFTLKLDLDAHNFELAAPGTVLGWLEPGAAWPVRAVGADGRDRSHDLFALQAGTLLFKRPLIPVMMTLNPEIARSDCLFYVTTRRPSPG